MDKNKLRLVADKYYKKGKVDIIEIGDDAYIVYGKDVVGPLKADNIDYLNYDYLLGIDGFGFIVITPTGLVVINDCEGKSDEFYCSYNIASSAHKIVEVLVNEWGISAIEEINKNSLSSYVNIKFRYESSYNMYIAALEMGTMLVCKGVWNDTNKNWVVEPKKYEVILFHDNIIEVVEKIYTGNGAKFINNIINSDGINVIGRECLEVRHFSGDVWSYKAVGSSGYDIAKIRDGVLNDRINSSYNEVYQVFDCESILICKCEDNSYDFLDINTLEKINKNYKIIKYSLKYNEDNHNTIMVKCKRNIGDTDSFYRLINMR